MQTAASFKSVLDILEFFRFDLALVLACHDVNVRVGVTFGGVVKLISAYWFISTYFHVDFAISACT